MAKEGKSVRKYGRNKVKCERYRAERRHEKNKLARILRCNGLAAAKVWANAHDIPSFLDAILKRRAAAQEARG